jgi:hypothetical protein
MKTTKTTAVAVLALVALAATAGADTCKATGASAKDRLLAQTSCDNARGTAYEIEISSSDIINSIAVTTKLRKKYADGAKSAGSAANREIAENYVRLLRTHFAAVGAQWQDERGRVIFECTDLGDNKPIFVWKWGR